MHGCHIDIKAYEPRARYRFIPNVAGGVKRRRDGDLGSPFGGLPLTSSDRRTIIFQYYDRGRSIKEIADSIPSPRLNESIDVKTVRRVLKYFDIHGHVERLVRIKQPLMSDEHAAIMLEIAEENPWLYLDEISAEMLTRTGISYSPKRIHKDLVVRGHSLKVMQYAATQRDEEKRQLYWFALFDLGVRPEHLLFCDETSKKHAALRRKRGWGGRGARVTRKCLLHHEKNLSVLALYGISGFLDFDITEGGFTSDSFMAAFEYVILPRLSAFPNPGSVLVLDNCQIHHTHETAMRAMVERVGAKLLFLAPYSPIDNPIEMAFNVFKAYWTRHAEYLQHLPVREAVEMCLFNCYEDKEAAAVATYRACGYY